MKKAKTFLSPQLDEFLAREVSNHETDEALGARSVKIASVEDGEKPYMAALAEYDSLSSTARVERHAEYRNFFQDALASVGALIPQELGESEVATFGAAVRQSYLNRKPPAYEDPETSAGPLVKSKRSQLAKKLKEIGKGEGKHIVKLLKKAGPVIKAASPTTAKSLLADKALLAGVLRAFDNDKRLTQILERKAKGDHGSADEELAGREQLRANKIITAGEFRSIVHDLQEVLLMPETAGGAIPLGYLVKFRDSRAYMFAVTRDGIEQKLSRLNGNQYKSVWAFFDVAAKKLGLDREKATVGDEEEAALKKEQLERVLKAAMAGKLSKRTIVDDFNAITPAGKYAAMIEVGEQGRGGMGQYNGEILAKMKKGQKIGTAKNVQTDTYDSSAAFDYKGKTYSIQVTDFGADWKTAQEEEGASADDKNLPPETAAGRNVGVAFNQATKSLSSLRSAVRIDRDLKNIPAVFIQEPLKAASHLTRLAETYVYDDELEGWNGHLSIAMKAAKRVEKDYKANFASADEDTAKLTGMDLHIIAEEIISGRKKLSQKDASELADLDRKGWVRLGQAFNSQYINFYGDPQEEGSADEEFSEWEGDGETAAGIGKYTPDSKNKRRGARRTAPNLQQLRSDIQKLKDKPTNKRNLDRRVKFLEGQLKVWEGNIKNFIDEFSRLAANQSQAEWADALEMLVESELDGYVNVILNDKKSLAKLKGIPNGAEAVQYMRKNLASVEEEFSEWEGDETAALKWKKSRSKSRPGWTSATGKFNVSITPKGGKFEVEITSGKGREAGYKAGNVTEAKQWAGEKIALLSSKG